ncbi:MAG: hypothetical protein HY735_03990 [Verrucomicrobia bacterium]|nr:hypothetical protein [Verrucomicrobiota bacterium]
MTVTPVTSFPLDGMQTASARFNVQAEAIARGEIEAERVAALIESQRALEANAAAARAADEAVGTIIDTFA